VICGVQGAGRAPALFRRRSALGDTIRGVKVLRRTSAPRDRAACRVEPFPRAQHQMVDWLGLMQRSGFLRGALMLLAAVAPNEDRPDETIEPA